MKFINSKNNVYVFKSFCYAFDLFGIFLIFLSIKTYFNGKETTISLACLYLAFIAIYIGTIYCKITIDLNKGEIYCYYLKFFRYKKFIFTISNLKSISGNIQRRYASNGIFYTSIIFTENSSENNIFVFELGTNKDKLIKSIEFMNSLIEQYKQNHKKKK